MPISSASFATIALAARREYGRRGSLSGTFGGLHHASGFTAWNVGASWRIPRVGDAYARVENLFDERYEEALGFPALGRRATVGLRIAAGR